MKKIAIVISSSCGLTEKQAKNRGWFYLPLNIQIDNKNYLDGIDLTSENLFDKFSKNSSGAKTSSTNIGYVLNLFEQLSNTFDAVVVFPLSEKLSGEYQNLVNFSNNFKNVYVINSLDVAQLISLKVIEFEHLIDSGVSLNEAIKKIENNPCQYSVTLIPKYNNFLVKGGRLTPGAAAVANLLKIIPMIKFENGKLEKEGIGRVFSKTILNCIENKLANLHKQELKNLDLIILHSQNPEIDKYIEYVKENYQINPLISYIPPVISIHTGPEAIVIIKHSKLSNKQRSLFE
ncbi:MULTISPECIES: DegV family protein [unclassified Mycoplasma]|uniref:DegV family protein n=1 Tax=unclassified Mycoplasma TaxID=2683645 RepID=UPI00211CBBA9|nr:MULTISPECIES: DegV family protein [unclassified Mycoplasma]UUM19989.1 DegV family protein [Mycoplasma sp. 1578d]UUM24970.1 DegV family protein [Mycoplasma sp. 3686d]